MVILWIKSRPEVSKKGDCVAEGKVQKPNVLPSEWHRDRDMGTPFPVQKWGAPNETSRWQKKNPTKQKNPKSQKCFVITKNAIKWNVSPQDAAYPVCVRGDAVSMLMCVSLWRRNSPSHKLLVTGGIFGRKYHPAFPLLSWYPPGSSYRSLLKTGYQARLLIWPQKDALMFFYSFVVVLTSWGISAGLHEEILYPFSE